MGKNRKRGPKLVGSEEKWALVDVITRRPQGGSSLIDLLFCCLQAPINDNKACVSMMGIKSTTTKAHITRAILESIAFR